MLLGVSPVLDTVRPMLTVMRRSLSQRALTDPVAGVRAEAMRALGRTYQGDPITLATARTALGDADAEVRIQAAALLGDERLVAHLEVTVGAHARPEPPRRESGYREYPEESVRLIRFIKRAQEVGFSLGEVRELLALRVEPGTSCAEVRRRAEQKVEDVRQKIADLKTIERALTRLAATCSGRGPISDCPILESLDGELFSSPGPAPRRQAT